jgi:hypothetical protein
MKERKQKVCLHGDMKKSNRTLCVCICGGQGGCWTLGLVFTSPVFFHLNQVPIRFSFSYFPNMVSSFCPDLPLTTSIFQVAGITDVCHYVCLMAEIGNCYIIHLEPWPSYIHLSSSWDYRYVIPCLGPTTYSFDFELTNQHEFICHMLTCLQRYTYMHIYIYVYISVHWKCMETIYNPGAMNIHRPKFYCCNISH